MGTVAPRSLKAGKISSLQQNRLKGFPLLLELEDKADNSFLRLIIWAV